MSFYRSKGKRALDCSLAAAALVLSSPLLLVTAAAILIEDGPPVLFRQRRTGKHLAPFEITKFRSYPVDSPNLPSSAASALRPTAVGRVIRRLNIDELPQLFQVLEGSMSLIGPRPSLPTQSELNRLREESGASVCLPGLTGLAQVSSYNGMPEAEKARLDAEYANGITLRRDLEILLRTVGYLLRPPPVY